MKLQSAIYTATIVVGFTAIWSGIATAASANRGTVFSPSVVARTVSVRQPYIRGMAKTPVRFRTEPGSVCQFENDRSAKPYQFVADPHGIVQFAVTVPDGRPIVNQAFVCRGAFAATRFMVSMRRTDSSAAAIPPQRALPVVNGAYISQFVLTNGFNPLTASNDVLMSHGLPPRPADYATNPERSTSWLEAAFTPNTSVSNASVPIPGEYAGSNANISSGNWSGVNAGGSSGTYNTVRGYWNVPTGYNTNYGSSTQSVLWVGIDGGYCGANNGICSPGNVYQDGSETDVTLQNGVYYEVTFGWWEEYPYNSVQDVYNVSTGDQMYGTFYKNIENGIVYGQYYLKDLTSGQVYQSAQNVGSNLSGDTVEWILEAPAASGVRQPLADYSTAQMTEAETVSGNTTLYYNQIASQSSYIVSNVTMYGSNYVDSTATETGTGTISWMWQNSN